jgi:hypothetical protein
MDKKEIRVEGKVTRFEFVGIYHSQIVWDLHKYELANIQIPFPFCVLDLSFGGVIAMCIR